MNKTMWSILAVSVCTVVLIGCTGPKAREEFINQPSFEKQIVIIPRTLDAVVASMSKQLKACGMSGQSQRRSMGTSVIDTKIMTIKKVSPTKAECEYRYNTSGALGEPKGRMYLYAIDFEAKDTHSTKATFYNYGDYMKDLRNALRKWAEGDVNSCHGYGIAQ